MDRPTVESGIDKILKQFNWDIKSILGNDNEAFISFIRGAYKDNTRRMYCSKLSKVFDSGYARSIFTDEEYVVAMDKWGKTRKAIQCQTVGGGGGGGGGAGKEGLEMTMRSDREKYKEIFEIYKNLLHNMFADNPTVSGALAALAMMAEAKLEAIAVSSPAAITESSSE